MPAKNVLGFASVWAQLNPQHPGLDDTEKRLRFLVLFFVGMSLYQVVAEFSMLAYCVQELAREPLACSCYLTLFLVVPAAALALAQRRPLGWTIAAGYLAYSVAGALFGLWAALTWRPSGVPVLDLMFPHPSPLASVLWGAVATGGLVALGQPAVRQVFAAGPRRLAAAGLLAAVLASAATLFR